jgi:hypothetical protein
VNIQGVDVPVPHTIVNEDLSNSVSNVHLNIMCAWTAEQRSGNSPHWCPCMDSAFLHLLNTEPWSVLPGQVAEVTGDPDQSNEDCGAEKCEDPVQAAFIFVLFKWDAHVSDVWQAVSLRVIMLKGFELSCLTSMLCAIRGVEAAASVRKGPLGRPLQLWIKNTTSSNSSHELKQWNLGAKRHCWRCIWFLQDT